MRRAPSNAPGARAALLWSSDLNIALQSGAWPSSTRAVSPNDPFSDSIRPHLADLRSLARRVLGSDDLADDAVQETLLAFWRLRQHPPVLRAWLRRAVMLRSLAIARSRRRRCRHESGACTCVTDALQPPMAVESRELAEHLEAALAGLPSHYRAAWLLRERQELEYHEIAQRLQVPIGTVRSRLNRARASLRAALSHMVAGG
jgi:RNA polymerase sigma-70 factor (ECF subfamily)